ncbi:MAG: cytochrome c-type biogenesis protein CcsB [Methylophagaceae bacterium]|jgi:cytochrome c-type biogenesis protein CcsB
MTTTILNKDSSPTAIRWSWWLSMMLAAIFLFSMYSQKFDVYEIGIVLFAATSLGLLGQNWAGFRVHLAAVAGLSLIGIQLYGDNLAAAESNFFLSYLLASQSAIMWMSALYVMATAAYFIGFFARKPFVEKVGSALTWSATTMGVVGLMVRWRESYLMGDDIGYVPVSNLYEVFILFSVITALLYLFYERRFRTRALGGFVLLVISAAVAFLLWYAFDRGAADIQPLVPALQSYWMKIHVPANFVGYGAFSMAAMIGVAYMLTSWARDNKSQGVLATAMPELIVIEDLMYKTIALGFAFFTVATVLGALWAAEAWGGYWSWDPKETWALIVWLNYAAWLHMRMIKGWHGRPMAWWAIIGLFVTLFAFLGVNMFLGGLHSYGEL